MPMRIVTLAERRVAAVSAKAAAIVTLREMLRQGASRFGGRYLLYGSAARGDLRPDSDVDLLLDFPDAAATLAAWEFAETECARVNIAADIRPVGLCDARFLAHVLPTALVLA